MPGMLLPVYSLLLQSKKVTYFKEDDPKAAMMTLTILGAIVVVIILAQIIRKGFSGSGTSSSGLKSGGKAAVSPRKFNAFTLFRISSAYGLNREQAKLLEFVFRNDSVSDPENVMKNPALLDRHFKKAYKTIERSSGSDEEAQLRLARLFNLRNAIEAAPAMTSSSSSPQLLENTPGILLYGNDSYPVKILISRGSNVITEVPRNALGTPLRITNGTKVTLSFFTNNNKGFSIEGQVAGTGNTVRGPGLKIAHSGKMKPLVKRQFKRKQTTMKCDLFLVRLDDSDTGRKKAPKLIIDNKKYSGAIQDISIGGCAIKTAAPIQVGSKLKINIDYTGNYLISVLGQIIRINRSGFTGTVIHIKFIKVPRRAFNSINSLVFGYDEDNLDRKWN